MLNETLLGHFVAQAPTAVAMFDRDMRYLASSVRWRQDHFLKDDLVGRSHYQAFPEITQNWKDCHRRGLAGEIVRAERDVFLRADGSRMWLRWEIQPWRQEQGEIGGIIIFADDITAYENEQERTRQSEAALRALGDNLPDCAVYRFARDPDGKVSVLYISAGVERLNGVSVEEVLADRRALYAQLVPEYWPKLLEAEEASRRDMSDFTLEAPFRRPDGEIRWMRLRSRPDQQSDGQIIWNGVQTDITDEKRREELQREADRRKSYLLEIADALKPLQDPVDIIAAVSERLGKQLGGNQVIYAEIDANEEFATIRREWSDGLMPTSIGVHPLANFGADLINELKLGKVNAIADVAADLRARSKVAMATYRARSIRAFLTVPLVKQGRLVAVLSVHQKEPRAWSALDIALVEETAERTWVAIECARAEEAQRDSEERLRFALTAADAGAWEWDLTTNANVWSEELWRLYGLEPHSCEPSYDAWLQTIHPDDRQAAARVVSEAAAEGRELAVEWRVRDSRGRDRWLLSRGGPLHHADQLKPRYIGVVFDITERKRSEERIGYLAHHDILTSLPNRLAFNDRLCEAIRKADERQSTVAVLCMDLDRFKEVNDVFGHVIGDELLRQVSKRFLAAANGAQIARVGGDEFNAMLSGKSLRTQASDVAKRLRDAVAAPFEIDNRQLRVGLSIGVAIYPDHGDMETMLASADAALYRAKAAGGAKVCFFDSALDNHLRERHAIMQDLKSAIEHDELLLHYQPQADAAGVIFGFEALVRWRHPRRGLVPPNVFIPIAEESDLISEIGDWVLREACREAASWPLPLNIAVNLSPMQFLKDGLPGLVHSVLIESGLPGHRLELEITERVLINDFSRVSSTLRQLKSLGVKVAMDDFGTGYSSLSYVHSFPFDKIKIDRSFVSSLHNNSSSQAIIRAIIGLGRGLQVPLIAEGVETQEQLEFLRSAGCDEAQGYLIGAPGPIDVYAAVVGRKTEMWLERASA